MNWLLSINWALIASLWYFGNGMLHDVFVLIKHKGKYDRELLRLLMDGHVLMLSGASQQQYKLNIAKQQCIRVNIFTDEAPYTIKLSVNGKHMTTPR